MAEDIEQRVRAIIVDRLRIAPERVIRTASFKEDLGADSLDMIELMMSLEEVTGKAIPEEDAAKMTTFGAVVDYLTAMK